ncbi:hypothetical protein RF11_00585 [Thelohanellus kitauei]|uniref:Proteasome assembly chaperone 2 n=1 Tax=Thelohanellus kitauei TaxID=669202 RepID=A0A0C2IUB0_THEKT|nr:hypothetical protein RF11_00585 [Thelohanellus kitauei]
MIEKTFSTRGSGTTTQPHIVNDFQKCVVNSMRQMSESQHDYIYPTVIIGYCDIAYVGCRLIYTLGPGPWLDFLDLKHLYPKNEGQCEIDSDGASKKLSGILWTSLPELKISLIMVSIDYKTAEKMSEIYVSLLTKLNERKVTEIVTLSTAHPTSYNFNECPLVVSHVSNHDPEIEVLTSLCLTIGIKFTVAIAPGYRFSGSLNTSDDQETSDALCGYLSKKYKIKKPIEIKKMRIDSSGNKILLPIYG